MAAPEAARRDGVDQAAAPSVAFYERGRNWVAGLVHFSGGYSPSSTDPGYWSLGVSPRWVRFVRDGIGVGATASFGVSEGESDEPVDYRVGAGFQAVFAWPLAPRFSFAVWPSLELQVSHQRGDNSWEPINLGILAVDCYAPFVYHPNGHVGIGFGPELWLLAAVAQSEQFGDALGPPSVGLTLRSFIGVSF